MNVPLVRNYLLDLQERIVGRLETIERAQFRRDAWTRDEGGGGVSRLIEQGNVLERGGVLFSHVTGDQLPGSASAHRPGIEGRTWEAMGLSLVLHPRNPYAPTVHLNVRFFIAQKADAEAIWWFGGGMDLTPYYGFTRTPSIFIERARKRSRRLAPTCIRATRNGATTTSISSIGRSHAASAASSTTT
jgi:coproporphyrinogen III oxidase